MFTRIVSLLLVPIYIASLVTPALQAATPGQEHIATRSTASNLPLVRTPDGIKVNRTLPVFAPSSQIASISQEPTDREIGALRLFSHRLVPTENAGSGSVLARVGRILGGNSAPTTTNDSRALAAQLAILQKSANPHDTAPLQTFLQTNAKSRWAPSLRHELARRLFAQGYFTRAIAEWESVWNQVKDGRDAGSLAVGDEVLAHLLEACMGLSDTKRLTDLIGAAETRPIGNVLEAKLGRAKQSVWLLKHKGGQNILCGPLALQGILRHEGRPFAPMRLDTATDDYIATGLPLTELRAYGEHYQLDLVMARRPARADIPVPCVMHSAGGHYSTLVERDGDNYFLVDRAMQFEGWVPRAAIDELASGNFLLRRDALPASWEKVSEAEGKNIFGRDGLHGQEPNGPNSPDCNQGAGGNGGGGCCGMPTYSFNAKLASVRIEDTPVGYTPPVGPPVYFRVAYKDLDDSKPATSPNFSNVGRVWAIDWVAWVDHVAGNLTASSRATVHVQGGGTEISTYRTATGKFGPNDRTFSTVTRTGTYTYTREMPDGSKEIYNTPDNPTTPNRVFLTQKLDPAGNTVTYTYDASLRLVAVTDAIGQVTTLEHNLAADPMKVTKVTDPFGRTALLGYNAQGQLNSLTDMIGLTSTFTYDATEFITSMTTPYGTTTFTKVQGSPAYNRTVTATDPLGQQERIQFIEPIDLPTTAPAVPASVNVGGVNVPFRAETARLGWRNSFYWSKQAMQQAPGDVRVARNYRWFTDANWLVTGVLESVKEPLEDPVWFNYPNQVVGTLPNYAGQGALPQKILRILPDGTPQLRQFYYNALGRVTNSIDPQGRSSVFVYASNLIDLVEVRQKVASNSFERIAQFTHHANHQLLTFTDAAGSTTTYSYNQRGQPVTMTNAKGETVTLNYDTNGYLISVDGPLPGTTDSGSFTYDAFGRVRTVTNVDGYVVTFDYDALNRPTVRTYPDGTFEQFTYDKLDRVAARDRLGRVTTFTYNARRELMQVRDPLDRVVRYDWCRCGQLSALIDPLNRTTSWDYDVQGRIIAKIHPDGSRTQYQYENNTSRLRQIIDPKGQFVLMQYNTDNSLREVSYPNAAVPTPAAQFSYENDYPRMASMTDGTGTTTYTYYPITSTPSPGAGALAAIDGPLLNDTVSFGYDELGRAVRRSVGASETVAQFDPLGRMTAQTSAIGTFNYTYDGASPRLTGITTPHNVVSALTYFGNSGDRRVQQIRHTRNATPLSQFDYSYDASGNVLNWSQQTGAAAPAVSSFRYDAANQITNAVVTRNAAPVHTYDYAYDPSANRKLERVDGAARSFVHNTLNEIVSSDAPPASDATYEWDGAQRLAAVVRGEQRSEFTYDGFGRRVRIVEKQNGVVTDDRRFVWCGLDISEERDGSGVAITKRFYAQGVQVTQGPTQGNYYYSWDHLGSIREMTDSTGAIRARYEYDPWGRPTRTQGDLQADFAFTGHYFHAPSGLHLAPFRAYDASLGRWLSRDPIQNAELLPEGPNLYHYAANNPVRFVDPTGELIPLLIAIGAGIWAVAEVGLSIYDAYDTTRTILDPCVGFWAKAFAGGLFVAGLLLPGGGYSAVDDVAEQAIKRGQSVLGHYPEYKELAEQLGARRFNIPTDIWNKMSPAEQWAANQKFLDRMIARGDEIILATPLDKIKPGSFFERELQYLRDRGFTPSADGTRMIPGGGH